MVWKSDNQGDKEETFIQTSRRGGDRQQGQRGLLAMRAGPREVADCGKNGAGSETASRPYGPTFAHT